MAVSDICLYPGQVHRVNLGGVGGTGYTWDYLIEGGEEIVSVSAEPSGALPMPPHGGPPPLTFSTEFIYAITAVKTGTARVRFQFHRPWERDAPPLREVVVDLSVVPGSENV